ncbi:uncharacterized protein LOC131041439 isoform X1 [Cryptomeria japonica]|uniref:uncharacterized protein LOC131041439 isoform X1 n=1 Tax=Cryptomeria japonica TaxID=3369 RepID=UPI0027D9EC44|nr:uncharacterized protein LOC131041439 isoform X1 [Cryptomeria japonica]
MYAGVDLNSEGREAALLLSCDDKITEVMCFVLKNIVDRFEENGERQAELDRLMESMMKNFSHGRTVFHYAADQPNNEKHAEYLAELISRNFEYGKEIIKGADKHGRTALHYAALHGHINLCTFLMNNCELKAKEKDRNGENLLHFVVNRGQAHIVYILLESTAVRNLFYLEDANGKTPLHKAAAIGDVDTMWTLLERVSLLDQRDTLLEEKNTLLDERVYVLVALLDTLVDKRVSLVDSLVDTLLDTLKKKREPSLDESEKEIVEKLLMDKEIVKQIVKEIVKEHEERTRKSIRQPDFFGQTALLEAVRGAHCEAVRYLLDKGSRPLFERNSEGKTALHYSVQITDKQAAIQMAEILLNHYTSREERLLLLWASAIGMGTAEQSAESSPELQSFLMQQRELTAGSSRDLLFSAIKLGYEALAWEFIDRGANTSQIDNLANRDLSDVERERFNKYRDMRRSKLKSTIVNSRQLIMRRYSHEERRAIAFLSTQTTDDPQLPREWKRFLLYHRLAWNIFLISKQGKNLSGWQVQLLVWTFCCWQWKDNVNCIMKDWKKLVSIKDDTVNDENPSFKTIVEHYVDRNVEPEERHKWQFLIQILFKYDVTMESIQSFEKFRLHCDIGYPLRLPPNAIESISSISNLESL